jgi:hypothetical protein
MCPSPEEIETIRRSEDYRNTRKKIERLSQVLIVHPDVANIYPSRYLQFRNMLPEALKKHTESVEMSRILREVKTQIVYNDLRVESMNKMLGYLGLVESLGVSYADIALTLSIASGSDLHTKGTATKHVTSFEDLQTLDLNYKLDFLEKEIGLPIFKRMINRNYRNYIAHLNFRIDTDGTIRDNGNSEIRINDAVGSFWNCVDTLELVFQDMNLWQRLEEVLERDPEEPIF